MDLKAIGLRIKKAREAKGQTQEQLAEQCNLSPQHISVIERGCKSPRLETLVLISNILEVSPDTLLQDVVNTAQQSSACALSEKISSLSRKDQNKILRIIEIMLES